jgi:hypothetical protein
VGCGLENGNSYYGDFEHSEHVSAGVTTKSKLLTKETNYIVRLVVYDSIFSQHTCYSIKQKKYSFNQNPNSKVGYHYPQVSDFSSASFYKH